MRLKIAITVACLLLLALPAAAGCSNRAPSTTTSTGNQPVEIVSVLGPIPPFNPGGPNVEITVKNIGTLAISHLVATLDLNLPTPPENYSFDFGLSEENTLAPGATASVTRTLINGRFDNDTFYTVSLDVLVPGTGGAITYDYSVQVQIGSPPPASS
jgi:hypothetical protein